jgi:hypothetical protein
MQFAALLRLMQVITAAMKVEEAGVDVHAVAGRVARLGNSALSA